jgi:hypothetical protein
MIHYKVVISGENIFFENDVATTEPIIGFISYQFIKAETAELAIAKAKRDLLVNWNQSFNADRKLGMPKLSVEHIALYKSWFKPHSPHDYHWFTNGEQKQQLLDKFVAPKRQWCRLLGR